MQLFSTFESIYSQFSMRAFKYILRLLFISAHSGSFSVTGLASLATLLLCLDHYSA